MDLHMILYSLLDILTFTITLLMTKQPQQQITQSFIKIKIYNSIVQSNPMQLSQLDSTYSPNLNTLSTHFQLQTHPYKPHCPSNFQAKFICLNPKCKGVVSREEKMFQDQKLSQLKVYSQGCVFVCANHDCKSCFYDTDSTSYRQGNNKKTGKITGVHSKCFVGDYQSLIACIQQKKKQSQPLKATITTIIDTFIDYLSDLRQNYLTQLQYYGLTDIQYNFLKCFEQRRYDELTSEICYKIVKELDYQPAVNGFMAKAKLQEYWEKEQLKVKRVFEHFDRIIGREFNSTVAMLELDTRIVTEEKEKITLIELLEGQQNKSIESMKLLYRASENNFDTDIFHQKCDRRPDTITVLQTQFGNKIGGYTPLMWDKSGNNRSDRDPTNKTFLFSLTHNHKFTLKPTHQAAILQYSSAGPTFGSGPSDIYIKNKANTVSMYGNVGNSYVNGEYVFGEQKSWTKFSGATAGKEFKAKEWEVFQVRWYEKL